MKFSILIILFIAGITQAQDTIHKYIDYGTSKQVHYIGIIKGTDTTWKEAGKGKSQSFSNKFQYDTLELIQEIQNLSKVYKETYDKAVKEIENTNPDLKDLQAILKYLYYKLDTERKKQK